MEVVDLSCRKFDMVETASCKFFVNHRVSTTLVVAMESCPNYFLSSRYQSQWVIVLERVGWKVVGTLIALTFHCSHKKKIQTSHIVATVTFFTTPRTRVCWFYF